MKVCTDACIFGAWIKPGNAQNILDIGSGTGLLSLLVATKTPSPITGIEIDASACEDARQNFSESVYANQLKLINTSVQEFAATTNEKFDLIISNPPFFENHLKSPNGPKNKALHQETLTLDELLASVLTLLSSDGRFWLMLPPHEANVFDNLLKSEELHLKSRLDIAKKEGQQAFRLISEYGKDWNGEVRFSTLAIAPASRKGYTEAFLELLGGYYL